MRTSKMKTTTVITALLMIATISVSAYNGNGRNSKSNNQHVSCTTEIEGLTQQQVDAIASMEVGHQKKMDVLRTERRSTTSEKSKAETRIKMIDARDNHRAEVKKLLTPQQQTNYDALHVTDNHNHAKNSKGNGKSRGNQNGSCRK